VTHEGPLPPYFSRYELCCTGTGIIKMDVRFADALMDLREAWGKPLSPSSVCRTPEHNAAIGGHPRSLHLTENPAWPTNGTMAADIRWRTWSADEKKRFAKFCWKLGWAVGLHDGFIHIDRRACLNLQQLPQAVFLYGNWSGAFSPDEVRR
jgi:hypothetical protein